MQPFFDLILAISDVLNREKEPIDLLDFFNDYSKKEKRINKNCSTSYFIFVVYHNYRTHGVVRLTFTFFWLKRVYVTKNGMANTVINDTIIIINSRGTE